MGELTKKLDPGLYFVAVPIGNARDITLRGLDILTCADVLVAEDTRSLRKLMAIHAIARNGRQILSYHDHNGEAQRPNILAQLKAGRSVAYAPEAGTAMIADPGFVLGREAILEGYGVWHAPGASALIVALCASGLGTDRLFFAGFAPARKAARRQYLEEIRDVNATLVIYESPRRVLKLLAEIMEVFGENHSIALCRELTKKFETVLRGKAVEIYAHIKEEGIKGECVLVLERYLGQKSSENTVLEDLREALLTKSLPSAAKIIAERHNISRAETYKLAVELKEKS